MEEHSELNRRELAILRAVECGNGEIVVGCATDLAVDGRWCDHVAATNIVVRGLVCAAHPGRTCERVHARLTESGRAALHPHADGNTAA